MSCCGGPLKEIDRAALAVCGLTADSAGLVVWLGMKWRGVPYPLRLWLLARLAWTDKEPRRFRALREFSQCGCIDRIKRLFSK